MNVLESALQYGEVGFCSFPVHGVNNQKCSCGNPACNRQGKHPMLNGWKYQASDKQDKLEALFKKQDSNIGIVTGSKSKLVVIDVDPKNGGLESYEALTKEYGQLDEHTLTSNTGGGGFHLYYRYAGNQIGNLHGTIFGSGIDIKGNDGYVVAAPSTHVSGLEYTWRDGFYQPADLDIDLEGAILKQDSIKSNKHTKVNWEKKAISEGNRNSRLTQIAGHYRARGKNFEEINSQLQSDNIERCKPPLSKHEVERIAKSVARYEKGFKDQTWKAYWLRCVYNESCSLTYSEKSALAVLYQMMDDSGGNCTPTGDLLALKGSTTRQTISKNLNGAADKGWLKITHLPKTNGSKGIFCSYLATIPDYNDKDN